MPTRTIFTAVAVLFVIVVTNVTGGFLVAARSAPPQQDGCSTLYVAPREHIVVEPHADGIRTKAQVYLRSPGPPGDAQAFTLQLWDSAGDGQVVSETIQTLPVLNGGLEIVTLLDVKPEFLRVDPDGQQPLQVTGNDPVYYFMLVWDAILDQLGFSDDPEQSDVGRVVIPMLYEVSPQYYSRADMFNYLVSRLTRLALVEDTEAGNQVAGKAVDDWTSELNNLPRMIVVIRWQDQPFSQDEAYRDLRNSMSTRSVPIVVIDIGQPIIGAEPGASIDLQDLYVLPLGPVPPQLGDGYPNPFDPTWDFARQYIARHVTNRTAAIIERAARPIRRRFEIDKTWPVVITQQQAGQFLLRVKTEIPGGGEELCSRGLVFPIAKTRSWTRRLALLYLGVLLMSGMTVASATYLLVSWLPATLTYLKKLYEEWKHLPNAQDS